MIRTLKPGEATPEGEPRRHVNSSGYVRLRWLVGPINYVEVYEHRFVAGLPPRDMDVHHLNRDRADADAREAHFQPSHGLCGVCAQNRAFGECGRCGADVEAGKGGLSSCCDAVLILTPEDAWSSR